MEIKDILLSVFTLDLLVIVIALITLLSTYYVAQIRSSKELVKTNYIKLREELRKIDQSIDDLQAKHL